MNWVEERNISKQNTCSNSNLIGIVKYVSRIIDHEIFLMTL